MKILAHRGYWGKDVANNSPAALRAAPEHGYGFESDIRDYMGELVISHNIADANCQKAEEVFKLLSEYGDKYCFAINIKADGTKDLLMDALERNGLHNYFCFDMSGPQMIEFREKGLTYFTRQSEVEPSPIMYEDAKGVWIDGFFGEDWITEDLLKAHIANGKTVCLVSPDLHKREYMEFWSRLKAYNLDFEKVMLCTDYLDEATAFFF